jgi:hypothetical protein
VIKPARHAGPVVPSLGLLTVLTIPKPFVGRIGDIQRNAIASWRALTPDNQIVLVGDEPGVGEAARDAGVDHVAAVDRNERGTPRLDSAFSLVAEVARFPTWCFVNADIVLLDDFAAAVLRVSNAFESFVMIGECRDLAVERGFRAEDPVARAQLRRQALDGGRLRGWAALDYFVFPQGLFDPLPPFLIGRACFDNWLVWRARARKHAVVDATRAVVAVHQSHDYSHVAGGQAEAYHGEEAKYNERLAGGRKHIYSLHDATHRLYRAGPPVRYLLSIGRLRERARVFKARYDAPEESHVRGLLAVLPRPSTSSTALLDAIAARSDVNLTALYGERGEALPPRGHVHWFPRGFRMPGRPSYTINWAIWNSFRGLKPQCMVLWGTNSFATQSAVAWCTARRVPYILITDELGLEGSRPLGRIALSGAAAVVAAQSHRDAGPTSRLDGDRLRNLPPEPDRAAALVIDLADAASQSQSGSNVSKRLRRLITPSRS